MSDPLAETAARLRALVPGFPDTYDVVLGRRRAAGSGWVRLDAVPVAEWCAEARERGNPRRLASVAAAAVGGALAHAVLARVTAALALDTARLGPRRGCRHGAPRARGATSIGWPSARLRGWWRATPPPPPRRRPRPPGRTAPAAARTRAARAPSPGRGARGGLAGRARRRRGGSDAPSPPVRVVSPTSPRCSTPSPLRPSRRSPRCSDEVRAATRFGLVPLWNAAGDAVRLTAEMAPRYAGRAPRPGLAPALLDALVAHGAPIRGRGEDQPLPGRAERVPVRAACCLAFRTDPPVARPSDALCTTCPLLPGPERARRYTAFLDGLPLA